MRLNAGCELTFDVAEPTPMVLMLRPRSGAGQWMTQESCVLNPFVPVNEYVDGYGNLCQRLVAPVGRFAITAGVTADVASEIDVQFGAPPTPIQYLPESFLQFLLPSRYCQADFLEDLAKEVVGGAQPGYDQVEAIRSWIHGNVAYRYGTSNASTSAIDTASRSVVATYTVGAGPNGIAFSREMINAEQ